MRLLKGVYYLLLFFMIFNWSCKPQGPLTPGDAFKRLKYLIASDPARAYIILSRESIGKLNTTVKTISMLNEKQLIHLAEIYGTTPEKMKDIKARDLFRLYMLSDKSEIKIALRYNIMGIDVNGESAVIKVENGMKLYFTREGPYWKLDVSKF